MSSWMNNSNSAPNDTDTDWLDHFEYLDEIKEESVEIKEEPFDDIPNIIHENLICIYSDDVKDEIEEIKEDFEDFADIKQEESILDGIHAIENESVWSKEELIDDIKEEELFTFPIADVFYTTTGDSSPLIFCPQPKIMKGTSTVNGPGRVTREAIIKLDRNRPHIKLDLLDPFKTAVTHNQPRLVQSGLSITDCSICKFLNPNSAEMEKHVRLMHPERRTWKCAFCDACHRDNTELAMHERSMHAGELKKIKELLSMSKCDVCDASFSLRSELANHLRLMHSNEVEKTSQSMRLVKCNFCDSFYKMGWMAKHVRSKHPETVETTTTVSRIFAPSTSVCNTGVAKKRVLYGNMARCAFCESSHRRGLVMDRHVRSMHSHVAIRSPHGKSSREAPLGRFMTKCTFCDASHQIGFVMDSHVRSMHSDELEKIRQRTRLKRCNFCDYFCEMGDAMDIHVQLMHREEMEKIRQRLWLKKCNFCDHFCEMGKEMVNHIVLMHSGKSAMRRRRAMLPGRSPEVRALPKAVDKMNGNRAKCDFCWDETHSYLISPDNLESARRFFNNLELTQAQRASTVRFFKNDCKRAIVCARHVKKKYSTASKSKSVNDGFALRMTPINRASNLELMKEKSIDEPGFSMLY